MLERDHHSSSVCAAKVRFARAGAFSSEMWTLHRPHVTDWFARIKACPRARQLLSAA
jgi:hypothetical protein